MIFAKSISEFVEKSGHWESAVLLLREIILANPELEEAIKWGAPAYIINKKNIIGIGSFKAYVGLWFHQGVFLSDPHKKLFNAQKGKTKALRQWRFSSLEEIEQNAEIIQAYVEEAIQNQKDGKEVKPVRKKSSVVIPKHLVAAFKADPKLKAAFDTLTPGRKREFAEYISEAKQEATKLKRIDKIIPMILDGIGLNDKYRK